MSIFPDLRLADAEITCIVAAGDELRVEYLDWQERQHALVFRNVVSYESFSPERRALSHGEEEIDPAVVGRACQLADEDPTAEFSVFSFVDAWKERKILRVVAKEVTLA